MWLKVIPSPADISCWLVVTYTDRLDVSVLADFPTDVILCGLFGQMSQPDSGATDWKTITHTISHLYVDKTCKVGWTGVTRSYVINTKVHQMTAASHKDLFLSFHNSYSIKLHGYIGQLLQIRGSRLAICYKQSTVKPTKTTHRRGLSGPLLTA